jgi:hypothetical protein
MSALLAPGAFVAPHVAARPAVTNPSKVLACRKEFTRSGNRNSADRDKINVNH